MPNNVYIGSRYVPIFDGNWDNTKTYEPLTIVNYNGGSYTSKQTVPAGTLPTNTTYWALTGNYNGQISNLQNQIDNIENTEIPNIVSSIGTLSDLDTSDKSSIVNAINEVLSDLGSISNRRFILIADSYGNYANANGKNFMEVARDDLGINAADCEILYQSAIGFHDSGFLNLLMTSTISDPDSVTDIIIFTGWNDRADNYQSALKTNIASFKAYVDTNFPNAKITVGDDAWSPYRYDSSENFDTVASNIKKACVANGVTFADYCNSGMHDSIYYLSDNIHPSASGVDILALILESVIVNGNGLIPRTTTLITMSNMTNYLYCATYGNGVNVWTNPTTAPIITFSGSITVNSWTELGTLTRTGLNCMSSRQQAFMAPCLVDNSHYCVLSFLIQGGKMYVCGEAQTVSSSIRILGANANFEMEYC